MVKFEQTETPVTWRVLLVDDLHDEGRFEYVVTTCSMKARAIARKLSPGFAVYAVDKAS